MEKRCCTCKKSIKIENFGPNKSKKDGLSDQCKICKKVAVNKYNRSKKGIENIKRFTLRNPEYRHNKYMEKREETIERVLKYQKTPEGKLGKKKADSKYKKTKKGKISLKRYQSKPYVKENHRKIAWMSTYRNLGISITYEEYEKKVQEASGKCNICNLNEIRLNSKGEVRRLSLDHCHNTGSVRGLLCGGCNAGLGFFKDNEEFLQNAIKYLQKHKELLGA